MTGALADEAKDAGEQTVTLGEEDFVALCDLIDWLDMFPSDFASDQPLDYAATAMQEELAFA
jgi:hypothetical protein